MKNVIRLATLLLLISFTLSGCYYDKENELYPSPRTVCDTTNVTYSKSIVPIMVANCNVCHSTALQQGYIITDNYNDLSVCLCAPYHCQRVLDKYITHLGHRW